MINNTSRGEHLVKLQNTSELLCVVGAEVLHIPTGIYSQMFVTACIFYRYTSSPTGLLSVFSVILHFFLSFSPCFHFKFQMALMSLGCSSSSVCCVSALALKRMGKFKRAHIAALDTCIKMLHVSRLNRYK